MRHDERNRVIHAIEGELEQVLNDQGYELVALRYSAYKTARTLSVYIDKPGGVSADDCAQISHQLSLLLDVLDPIPYRYQLIVSSPGLERPLAKLEHFARFQGSQAQVRYHEGGRRRSLTGKIAGTQGSDVILLVEGRQRRVALQQIDDAHLVCDWDKLLAEHGHSDASAQPEHGHNGPKGEPLMNEVADR